MGVSIDYWTTAEVEPSRKRQIEEKAAAFVRGRRWWVESLCFFAWPGKDGQLAGSTKFFRSDADVEDDMFMAGVDLRAVLESLASWSAEFGVDWEVQLAGEKWGTIRGGKMDAPLKKFCTQAKKSAGKPAEAEKRIAEIFREYDGDSAAPPAPKNVKQLQARWTDKQIRCINEFIAVQESTSALMRNKLFPRRALPVGLVPTFDEAGTTWHDLRGFPLGRCNALAVDHVDLSHCKAPKPKNKNLPGLGIIMTNCQLTDCRLFGSGPFYSCGAEFERCDFRSARLRGANVVRTVFRDCDFSDADLGRIEVSISEVFRNCRFERTRFAKSELGMMTFSNCVFRGCDWSKAYLPSVRFKGCDVRGENFAGTDCPATAFDPKCQTDGIKR